MRRNFSASILIGILLVTACVLTPVTTPTYGVTPMDTPVATAEISTPTPEPPATETPSPTLPVGFFPIIAGDAVNPDAAILLGGTEGGAWIDAETAASRLNGGEVYNLYSPAGPVGTTIGSKPARGRICPQYSLQWNPAPTAENVIGLGGNWNALPRLPEDLSTGDESYRAVAADWWAAQGWPGADVRLTRILRVDMDGNGTPEVLIAATRMSEVTGHDVAAGDYSAVFLHKETAPQTLRLVGDYYPAAKALAFPITYSLTSVLDLNGDGKMEVVVGVRRWEGGGTLIYAFDGTAVLEVFDTVCAL